MPDAIEIRPDGEVRASHLSVGRIEFTSLFPQEFTGSWVPDEHQEDVSEVDSLREQISDLERDLSNADEDRQEAQSAQEDAERTLSSLQDEVRAFLVGGSFCDDAVARLRGALEDSQ